jgi:hypothetical protein
MCKAERRCINQFMPRWYKNPKRDHSVVSSCTFDHAGAFSQHSSNQNHLPGVLLSNPIERVPHAQEATPVPSTTTVGAREVNHEANAILRPMLAAIRTQEELEEVVEDLRALK